MIKTLTLAALFLAGTLAAQEKTGKKKTITIINGDTLVKEEVLISTDDPKKAGEEIVFDIDNLDLEITVNGEEVEIKNHGKPMDLKGEKKIIIVDSDNKKCEQRCRVVVKNREVKGGKEENVIIIDSGKDGKKKEKKIIIEKSDE